MTYYPTRLDDDEKASPEARNAPDVIEKALFQARVVMLTGEVNDMQARRVTERLFALAAENAEPITFVISSPGGHVESGDTIHDVMRFCGPKVKAIGTGWVASAGVTIFLGADRENRVCLPNTRFLLHQPSGGVRGQASDIQIEAEEIVKMRQRMNRLIARESGQTYEKIVKDTQRNFWMSAEEGVAYGLASRIVSSAIEV